ncbi:cytochrome c oxidase subunit 3 [Methylovulum psychrotolerans]|jgi:cytochrome c oxidase subunit 3|uniref:cytochrome-c oxidase n=1 Tax=Methylovulum psychrotolerans TaxID=1704499 RepID=A0A1Z4BTE2_9GAMM|nr:cytochrome c oxidase subunit 3 [Methylovulum psychrotolerans]ASF44586.1 cytochrome c oxidase subunit 3 [Methylovulum psychrotolerans]MBT9098671.1 cytochrome c oxidase subunit 3 [Methylovulum psychrotolerans]POZ52733.1 cytochrome c oxidase subunit 3 [Methylovulum psychrotolerans]
MSAHDTYYIPHKATWPVLATLGLVTLLAGFANYLNHSPIGSPMMMVGFAIFIVMLAGWFTLQSTESESGMYNAQVGISFRMGMMWFIFSEVMFFAVFFGSLWYTRNLSVPWLGGEGIGAATKALLWPEFEAHWPTNGPAKLINGLPTQDGEFEPMGAWGLPLLNTLILLTSGVTCTWAHHGLLANKRDQLIKGLIATVALGFLFVAFQAMEYHEAYTEMGLTLGSGIYGSTFFMLTGFHGFHVCVGAIILSVVLFRSSKGHFKPENHFAFEAAAWYWHFVDVVWLGLFIFVYLI